MAECEWALLCDYAFLDRAGKMCLIGIFDNIYVRGVPAIHAQAAVVVQLRGEPGQRLRVRLEAVRPTGSSLFKIDGEAICGPIGGAGVQFAMPLQLPDLGYYPVNVYVDDELSFKAGFSVATPPANRPS
jgi:hypothetical protein